LEANNAYLDYKRDSINDFGRCNHCGDYDKPTVTATVNAMKEYINKVETNFDFR
jgi:hypothetical protein